MATFHRRWAVALVKQIGSMFGFGPCMFERQMHPSQWTDASAKWPGSMLA